MAGCSVLWCGKYHQNWENDYHNHSFFQLIAIRSGFGRVMLEDKEYAIARGKIFLIEPQKTHAVFCDPGSSAPLKMLDIKFSVADRVLFADLLAVGECFTLEDFSWFGAMFEKILRESEEKAPHYYAMISNYLESMLIQIIRERLSMRPVEDTGLPAKAQESIRGVNIASLMRYIQFNYSKIISLDDLSALAQVNKTTLIQIFKELHGTTPIRYINRIRMQKAKELLVNTDLGVGEIAELIGFQSIHYFSRYFRQKEGCSPIEYRVRHSQSKYFQF